MIQDLPIEMLNLIFLFTIHPYNNYHYILLLVFNNRIIRNTILALKQIRMKCSICDKNIYNNGVYCSQNNKPICCIHILFCKKCNTNVDIYQYSLLFEQCRSCVSKLDI